MASPSLLTKAGRLGLDIARDSLPGFRSAENVAVFARHLIGTLYSLLVFAYARFSVYSC